MICGALYGNQISLKENEKDNKLFGFLKFIKNVGYYFSDVNFMCFIVMLTNVYHRKLVLSEKQSFLMYYLIGKKYA